jgi:hypothetical protein
MRIFCALGLLTAAACFESAWIRRFGNSQCLELCTSATDRNCILSGKYNPTTRSFDVLLNMCLGADGGKNCFEDSEYAWIADILQPQTANTSSASIQCIRDISLESQYDSYEITMRTVYRENVITPMRLYRNTTPEYKALLDSANKNQGAVSTEIPYRFTMQYAGSRDQVQAAIVQSVQTLMHLYAVPETMWSYTFEFEKSGRYQHDVMLLLNASANNMRNDCATGFERSYANEPDYACIGNKCGMIPPCAPVNKPATCAENTFRLLAGPACRPLPPAGSLCEQLLQYITGEKSPAEISQSAEQVLSRIVDLECADSAGAAIYVLVDALDSNGSEHEALAELFKQENTAGAPVRCCVPLLDPAADSSVCKICPDMHSYRRRLLANAYAQPQDLSVQWYVFDIEQAQATEGGSAASNLGASPVQVLLIVLACALGVLLLFFLCMYKSFYSCNSNPVQPLHLHHEMKPLLFLRLPP